MADPVSLFVRLVLVFVRLVLVFVRLVFVFVRLVFVFVRLVFVFVLSSPILCRAQLAPPNQGWVQTRICISIQKLFVFVFELKITKGHVFDI